MTVPMRASARSARGRMGDGQDPSCPVIKYAASLSPPRLYACFAPENRLIFFVVVISRGSLRTTTREMRW